MLHTLLGRLWHVTGVIVPTITDVPRNSQESLDAASFLILEIQKNGVLQHLDTSSGVMWSLRITDSTGPDLIVNSKSCSWLEEWTIQWIFIHNFNQPLYRSLMMLMSKLLMKQNLRSHSCFFETCNPGNTAFLCAEKPDAWTKSDWPTASGSNHVKHLKWRANQGVNDSQLHCR